MKNYIIDYQFIMVDGEYRHEDRFKKTYRVNHAKTAKDMFEIEINKNIEDMKKKRVDLEFQYKILNIREEM